MEMEIYEPINRFDLVIAVRCRTMAPGVRRGLRKSIAEGHGSERTDKRTHIRFVRGE
jgi:hypothetical protein